MATKTQHVANGQFFLNSRHRTAKIKQMKCYHDNKVCIRETVEHSNHSNNPIFYPALLQINIPQSIMACVIWEGKGIFKKYVKYMRKKKMHGSRTHLKWGEDGDRMILLANML